MEKSQLKRIEEIKRKLRLSGDLPNYGETLTEEQERIIEQLKQGDFSWWEQYQLDKFQKASQPVTRKFNTKVTKNKINYIKKKLREHGYLPAVGEPMTEEQQRIDKEISEGNFTFYLENVDRTVKTKPYHCTKCGETEETKFYPRRKNACKKCMGKYFQKRYRGDSENIGERNKKWRERNFIRVRVLGAKHRALRKNFEFELTVDIIMEKFKQQKGKCYFTGLDMTFNVNDLRGLSIDRLDSSIGYTVENTILVTCFINTAKNRMNENDFREEIRLCYEGMFGKK